MHSANKKQQIKWPGQAGVQTLRRWQRSNRFFLPVQHEPGNQSLIIHSFWQVEVEAENPRQTAAPLPSQSVSPPLKKMMLAQVINQIRPEMK